MTKPATAAGRKHVDWLTQANIPHFSGELYRSNHTASVLAIEAEAAQQERERLLDLLQQLPVWTTRVNVIKAILDAEADRA